MGRAGGSACRVVPGPERRRSTSRFSPGGSLPRRLRSSRVPADASRSGWRLRRIPRGRPACSPRSSPTICSSGRRTRWIVLDDYHYVAGLTVERAVRRHAGASRPRAASDRDAWQAVMGGWASHPLRRRPGDHADGARDECRRGGGGVRRPACRADTGAARDRRRLACGDRARERRRCGPGSRRGHAGSAVRVLRGRGVSRPRHCPCAPALRSSAPCPSSTAS